MCEILGNCDPGYLLGIYDESTKGLHEVSEASGLSERSITELQRNPRAVTLVNALLESSQINDLSRFYATLKVALDLQKEHYENIEQELIQVFSVPMIDEDKDWYREKIEEQDMDSVRFSEYLCRDAFSKFTAEIISGNS